MANTKKILIDVKVSDKNASASIKKTQKNVASLADSTRDFTQAQKGANEAIQKGATSAGLAGAIVTEFGRTVSDLPFGFVAISNNLSQLASLTGLFFANAKRSGLSAVEAFTELKKQFLGPVGIITLFQILITVLQNEKVQKFISSIFQLSSSLQLLRDILPNVNKNAESLVGNFKIYTDILSDTTRSQEQKTLALEKLNEKYPDFNANTLVDANNNLDAADAIDTYIEALKRKAIAQAAQDKIQQLSGDIIEKQFEQEIKLSEAATKFNKSQNEVQYKSVRENLVLTQKEKIESYSRSTQLINDETESFVKGKQKEIDFYMKFITLDKNTRKKSEKDGDRRIKIFDAQFLELDKIEEQYRKKSVDRSQLTSEEVLGQIQQDAFTELDIKEELFLKNQQQRRDDFIAEIKERDISEEKKQELIDDANKKYLDSERKVGEERITVEEQILAYITSLRTKEIRRQAEASRLEQERVEDENRNLRVKNAEITLKELSVLEEDGQLLRNEKAITLDNDLLQQKVESTDAEMERLRTLLNNEELVGIARANIEKQYTDVKQQNVDARIEIANREARSQQMFIDDISSSLMTLSNMQEQGTKEAKALAIASTLISTYSAAQRAYESQMTLSPDSPIRAVVAAAAAVLSGLARVQQIRAVDVNKKSVSSSSGTTAQVTATAPQFNVVGTGATNQLAQAVGQQQQQPLKAFVVGSEVTKQQELDRKILNTAGI